MQSPFWQRNCWAEQSVVLFAFPKSDLYAIRNSRLIIIFLPLHPISIPSSFSLFPNLILVQLGSQLIITLSPYSYLQEIQHKIVYRSNLCLAIFLMFVGASQNLFCMLAQIRFCLKCLWSCRPFLSRDHIDHIDNSLEHFLVLLPFPSPTVFTFS